MGTAIARLDLHMWTVIGMNAHMDASQQQDDDDKQPLTPATAADTLTTVKKRSASAADPPTTGKKARREEILAHDVSQAEEKILDSLLPYGIENYEEDVQKRALQMMHRIEREPSKAINIAWEEGVIFEEAVTRCGNQDALHDAVSAGRVKSEGGNDNWKHNFYKFPRTAVGNIDGTAS